MPDNRFYTRNTLLPPFVSIACTNITSDTYPVNISISNDDTRLTDAVPLFFQEPIRFAEGSAVTFLGDTEVFTVLSVIPCECGCGQYVHALSNNIDVFGDQIVAAAIKRYVKKATLEYGDL